MDVRVLIDLTERTERAVRDLVDALRNKKTCQCDDTLKMEIAPAPAPAVPLATTPAVPPVSRAQVAGAGAALIQDNPEKKDQLLGLLKEFGAPSVADIPEEHLGAFAEKLRTLGAEL